MSVRYIYVLGCIYKLYDIHAKLKLNLFASPRARFTIAIRVFRIRAADQLTIADRDPVQDSAFSLGTAAQRSAAAA
jgi:hypothetical protein